MSLSSFFLSFFVCLPFASAKQITRPHVGSLCEIKAGKRDGATLPVTIFGRLCSKDKNVDPQVTVPSCTSGTWTTGMIFFGNPQRASEFDAKLKELQSIYECQKVQARAESLLSAQASTPTVVLIGVETGAPYGFMPSGAVIYLGPRRQVMKQISFKTQPLEDYANGSTVVPLEETLADSEGMPAEPPRVGSRRD